MPTVEEQLDALDRQRASLTAQVMALDPTAPEREALRAELAAVKTEILRLTDPGDDRTYR